LLLNRAPIFSQIPISCCLPFERFVLHRSCKPSYALDQAHNITRSQVHIVNRCP
jgi:hypothetical protein